MNYLIRDDTHDPVIWKRDKEQMLIGITVWTLIYLVLRMVPIRMIVRDVKLSLKDELDLKNRMISFIHGSTVLILSSFQYFKGGADCGQLNS